MDRIVRLWNPIQHYAWGSHTAISELLGEASPSELPQAELWIGAHPSAPSRLVEGDGAALDAAIAEDPEAALGPEVAARFGSRLPFLLKVLAADAPLSLQAHPDAKQAAEGFARENAAGVPLDSPRRCYRDPYAKPELLCALTPFDALVGFRPVPEIVSRFRRLDIAELAGGVEGLASEPDSGGLARFFEALLYLTPDRLARALSGAVRSATSARGEDVAFAWLLDLHRLYPGDVGAFAPLLLRPFHLEPGQAVALGPGVIHAYLGGAGIELMGSSDNVLRGGLTEKHVDVPELLHVLRFDDREPRVLAAHPASTVERVYAADGLAFALSVMRVRDGARCEHGAERSVELLLCTEGRGRLRSSRLDDGYPFGPGDSFCVPAAAGPYVVEGRATLYRAFVPPAALAG